MLIIAGLALPFELLDAFVKNNFLNIMAVVMVLSIFLLNYFDKLYIRACIVFLAISVLLDLFWLIGLAGVNLLLFLDLLESCGSNSSLYSRSGISALYSGDDDHTDAGSRTFCFT